MKQAIYLTLLAIAGTSLQAAHYKLTNRTTEPGFFSEFHTLLGALDFYETNPECTGLEVDFQFGAFFDHRHGRNYWEYYFEPINIEKKPQEADQDRVKFKNWMLQSYFPLYAQYVLSRERSAELIKRYIKPKPHIQQKVDQFYNQHFKNKYVIGIHYRGTDKYLEAPKCSYEAVCNAIDPELSLHQDAVIFIASDDQNFVDFARELFPEKVISIAMKRSTNNLPIHTPNSMMYDVGESAVIDYLLLSRCSQHL